MKMDKLGVQLYTVRAFMETEEDVRTTFRKLKAIGYDFGQTAGCKISYEDYGRIAREEGFGIVGTHDSYALMIQDFDQALANHKALGTYFMGVGGRNYTTLEEWQQFFKEAGEIGAKLAEFGGKFTYHNHSHEFRKWENGKTTMDMLAEGMDPKTTSFVLDTYWVQHGGGDVRYWIEKLAGRIDILHLKDMKMTIKADGTRTQEYTEIGQGNLYWQGIMETAEKAGVRYYVVEQDTCPGDPFESLKISSDYIHKNFM